MHAFIRITMHRYVYSEVRTYMCTKILHTRICTHAFTLAQPHMHMHICMVAPSCLRACALACVRAFTRTRACGSLHYQYLSSIANCCTSSHDPARCCTLTFGSRSAAPPCTLPFSSRNVAPFCTLTFWNKIRQCAAPFLQIW